MTPEQFSREKNYQIAMSMTRMLLNRSLISPDEFNKINNSMIEKYRPFCGCLYR